MSALSKQQLFYRYSENYIRLENRTNYSEITHSSQLYNSHPTNTLNILNHLNNLLSKLCRSSQVLLDTRLLTSISTSGLLVNGPGTGQLLLGLVVLDSLLDT